MPFRKIDSEGNYCPFPGVTVVAAVKQEDPFWRCLYYQLSTNPIIREHYSLLPAQSYHMTAINLFTENTIGSTKWDSFIRENLPLFKSLKEAFVKNEFEPEISLQAIIMKNVLQILIQLPPAQKESIQKIAKKKKLGSYVPESFHITLAYQFRRIDNYEKIKEELDKIFLHVIDVYPFPKHLQPAKLCYFYDMQAFIPWENPSDSPFKPELMENFFNQQTKKETPHEQASGLRP